MISGVFCTIYVTLFVANDSLASKDYKYLPPSKPKTCSNLFGRQFSFEKNNFLVLKFMPISKYVIFVFQQSVVMWYFLYYSQQSFIKFTSVFDESWTQVFDVEVYDWTLFTLNKESRQYFRTTTLVDWNGCVESLLMAMAQDKRV